MTFIFQSCSLDFLNAPSTFLLHGFTFGVFGIGLCESIFNMLALHQLKVVMFFILTAISTLAVTTILSTKKTWQRAILVGNIEEK